MPIKFISIDQQKPLIDLVDKIISIKKRKTTVDTTTLENKKDQLVYELYDLTDEEISIIEGK